MQVLVDTNVIARSVQPAQPAHTTAMLALQRLRERPIELCIATQSMFELYVVATRPVANNGLGLQTREVLREIERLENIFTIIPESSSTYPRWLKLMNENEISGKSAHDGRLVATMLTNNIETILTFNVNDFSRYKQITLFNPESLVAERR